MLNCPQEICDSIIDLLHDDSKTLKKCCLVSKSWVSRTRKYLFGLTVIREEGDYLKWTNTFPDPTENSPAYHSHTLVIVVKALLEAKDTNWICAFTRVKRLVLQFSSLPFNKVASEFSTIASFSILEPSLEALEMCFTDRPPCPQHFALIHSLSPLKYLSLQDYPTFIRYKRGSDKSPEGLAPLTSSPFSWTLQIAGNKFTERWVRHLLDLPGGLHFTEVALHSRHDERNHQLLVEFIAACSHTLECLVIVWEPDGELAPRPIDLSGLTKLKRILVIWYDSSVEWITGTLNTITSKHLRKISLRPRHHNTTIFLEGTAARDEVRRPWLDLARVLLKFSESHSIRSEIYCRQRAPEVEAFFEYLLPNSSRSRFVALDPLDWSR